MAFSEKTIQLMEDPAFKAKLEAAEDFEAYKAMFAAEGIDYEAEFAADEPISEELSAEELENVAGGVSLGDLTRIVQRAASIVASGKINPFKTGWKFGSSCGILLRAYYDIKVHNDVCYSYSKSQIEDAARYLGCM